MHSSGSLLRQPALPSFFWTPRRRTSNLKKRKSSHCIPKPFNTKNYMKSLTRLRTRLWKWKKTFRKKEKKNKSSCKNKNDKSLSNRKGHSRKKSQRGKIFWRGWSHKFHNKSSCTLSNETLTLLDTTFTMFLRSSGPTWMKSLWQENTFLLRCISWEF